MVMKVFNKPLNKARELGNLQVVELYNDKKYGGD